MNAADHVAEAERLVELSSQPNIPPDGRDRNVARAQVHATLALVATLTPRDDRPEPHSTAWCNARDAWNSVDTGPRFDELDPDRQAALAELWQARHG